MKVAIYEEGRITFENVGSLIQSIPGVGSIDVGRLTRYPVQAHGRQFAIYAASEVELAKAVLDHANEIFAEVC